MPEKPPDPFAESLVQLRAFIPAFLSGVERVVVELRGLASPRKYGGPIVRSGFFDLPVARKEFAHAVRDLICDSAGQPEGIYLTLNSLDPDLLARANNRIKDQMGKGAACAADCSGALLVTTEEVLSEFLTAVSAHGDRTRRLACRLVR